MSKTACVAINPETADLVHLPQKLTDFRPYAIGTDERGGGDFPTVLGDHGDIFAIVLERDDAAIEPNGGLCLPHRRDNRVVRCVLMERRGDLHKLKLYLDVSLLVSECRRTRRL